MFSDLKVSKSSPEESIETADPPKCLVDGEGTHDEKEASSSWFEGVFPQKMEEWKEPEKPLPFVQEDCVILQLRLSVSNIYLPKGGYQPWQETFVSSVDRLTVSQALIFGPAFACLFVILGIPAHMPSGISEVAEQMVKLCDTSLDRVPSGVAKMVGRFEVKMPPLKKLKKLLSVYAEVKPPPVYFNTVVGGFMYASHKRKWSVLTEDSVTFVLISARAYHDYHTPLTSSLEHVKIMARICHRPRIADLYFAFVERNFPVSWRAFCRVTENYNTPKLGKYDPFWDYSRAFSDQVFDELTYERNHRVCNVTAVVEDLFDGSPGSCVWPTYGYTYENLVKDKPTSLRITRNDALLAESIFNILQKE